jgi:hypothetical protein
MGMSTTEMGMSATEEAQALAAAHIARARRANDWMWESLRGSRWGEPIPFFCECGRDRCYEPVWLTGAEYAQRRRDPAWRAATASRLVAGNHAL